jgi:hypothetical protein
MAIAASIVVRKRVACTGAVNRIMKTSYILTHRWQVKISGLSGIPKIVCLVGPDWPARLTHRDRMDGFEVVGPLDNFTYDENAVLVADHIVKLHNGSLEHGRV